MLFALSPGITLCPSPSLGYVIQAVNMCLLIRGKIHNTTRIKPLHSFDCLFSAKREPPTIQVKLPHPGNQGIHLYMFPKLNMFTRQRYETFVLLQIKRVN